MWHGTRCFLDTRFMVLFGRARLLGTRREHRVTRWNMTFVFACLEGGLCSGSGYLIECDFVCSRSGRSRFRLGESLFLGLVEG